MSLIKRRKPIASHEEMPSDLHNVVKRVYANRVKEVTDHTQLDLTNMKAPYSIKDIDKGSDILIDSLKNKRHIIIAGDYDVDGATSTSMMLLSLRKLSKILGGGEVSYAIPNRFKDGYGLSPKLVDRIHEMGGELIITVDNGISNHEGVDYANSLGMSVIITDHHLQAETLPNAEAVIDPQRNDDDSGLGYLAGVGVAFYFLIVVVRKLIDSGYISKKQFNVADYLDIVAIGTISDLVVLDRNNRILAEQGLRRIRTGSTTAGIKALMEVARVEPPYLESPQISFSVAPRLNAAGRMDDMSIGVECLITEDIEKGRELASRLDAFNRSRREIEGEMTEEALADIEKKITREGFGICVYSPDWHQGITGIVASRIKERFGCPVVVFASDDDGVAKGSARSVPGLHIRDLMVTINSKYPELIEKFGGHAMAAGLSVKVDNIPKFERVFEEELKIAFNNEPPTLYWETDGELKDDEMSLETAEKLMQAGPWGMGFPPPIFDGVFIISDMREIGDPDAGHLKFELTSTTNQMYSWEAIGFFGKKKGWDKLGDTVRVVYELDLNRYKGNVSLQLRVQHMENI